MRTDPRMAALAAGAAVSGLAAYSGIVARHPGEGAALALAAFLVAAVLAAVALLAARW